MKNKQVWILVGIVVVIFAFVIIKNKSMLDETRQIDEISEMPEVTLKGEPVNYYQDVNGYLSLPDGDGPFPAVVLIHEWWGLNDNIRDLADMLADQGYVALAVDLYNGESTTDADKARQLSSDVRENPDQALENLTAAVDFLKNRDEVNPDSLGSVGWCFGGGWSYQMAKNDLGLDAAVVYYGQFDLEDDLSNTQTKILGQFGEDDTSIKVEDVKKLETKLQDLDEKNQIFVYPNAGHAFANRDSATSYVPEAADQAWKRTLEFLSENLK